MSITDCTSKFNTSDVINRTISCVDDKAKDIFYSTPQHNGIVKQKTVNENIWTFLALYSFTIICKLNDMN